MNSIFVSMVAIVIVAAVVGALMLQDDFSSMFFPNDEHYQIKIAGMKDVYLVGEQYDFSYIISGYGHQCGSKKVIFPDENGDTVIVNTSASCVANEPMKNFVFDIQKEEGTTFGHIKINRPGNYGIAVEFERGGFEPTLGGHNFIVAENICDDADVRKQAQCFSDSYGSCQSAYMTQRFQEESGGIVSVKAVVESWNDCRLVVYTENSLGEHTPFNGIRSTCENLHVTDYSISLDECDNAKYPPILFN